MHVFASTIWKPVLHHFLAYFTFRPPQGVFHLSPCLFISPVAGLFSLFLFSGFLLSVLSSRISELWLWLLFVVVVVVVVGVIGIFMLIYVFISVSVY